jgi:hypothetical protein
MGWVLTGPGLSAVWLSAPGELGRQDHHLIQVLAPSLTCNPPPTPAPCPREGCNQLSRGATPATRDATGV